MDNNDDRIKALRAQLKVCRGLAAQIDRSRESAIVVTKLDEAALWADAICNSFSPKIDTLA